MDRKKARLFVLWSILGAGVVFALWGFSNLYLQDKKNNGLIHASGRIEGTEVTVGTKVPGRVERLLVQEGDVVEKGSLLAEISSEEVKARWERQEAAILLSQRNLARQRESVQYSEHKLQEAETSLQLTREQIKERVAHAEAGLGAATAALIRGEANLDWSQKESRRLEDLYRQGITSAQAVDSARSSLRISSAEVERLRKEKEIAKVAVKLARDTAGMQIDLAEKELAAARSMKGQAREAVEATRMETKMAESAAREAEVIWNECRITAPIRGTVMTKIAEEGEVLDAGRPLLTLVDLTDVYLKMYIPQVEIGKIRLGNASRIHVDAYPDRFFEAKVTQISQQAEFTPKNVETKQERVNLVFAVKLTATDPQGLLKPGMPADGVIKYKDQMPWPK